MFGKKKTAEENMDTTDEAKKPTAETPAAAEQTAGEQPADSAPTADEAAEAKPGKQPAAEQKPAEEQPSEGQPAAEPPAADEKPAEEKKPEEPDWKKLYALTLADFDNYKKRAARDREDVYRYAESDILNDVLPTVDNLALALANAKDKENDFVKGVQLVYDSLLKALKDHGAEPFDSVGKELDTEKMEAIATLPSPDFEEGKVSIESKRGWMLKDKVLRVAQVVVSSGKQG